MISSSRGSIGDMATTLSARPFADLAISHLLPVLVLDSHSHCSRVRRTSYRQTSTEVARFFEVSIPQGHRMAPAKKRGVAMRALSGCVSDDRRDTEEDLT